MAYQYEDPLGYDPDTVFDQGWVRVDCIKNNSPNRPPVLNKDNVSSSEAGAQENDPSAAAQAHAQGRDIDNLHFDSEHPPSSYASSNSGSVQAPDGPEIRDPGNKFLPVAPDIGLGEEEHRRRASFDDEGDRLVRSIRKYLKTLPRHERSCHASWEGVGLQGGFLPLNTHIGGSSDSVQATRGKSSGSPSDGPGSGYSVASSGLRSSNMDPAAWSGAWIRDSVFGDWPLEIPEDAIEEDVG